MSDPEVVERILEPYLEEDDLLVDDEYKFDEESRKLTFKVDIITEEIDVCVTFSEEGKGAGIVIGDYATRARVGTLEKILEKVMNQIVSTRDKNLEVLSPSTPSASLDTPGGGWDEFDPFKNPEQDHVTIEMATTPLSHQNNVLYSDSEIASRLFGKASVTVILGTSNIRLSVLAKYMENETRLAYRIPEEKSVTFSLSFNGKDYRKVDKEPSVGGNFTEDAFGEQILNIARSFVTRRWKQFKDKLTLPNLDEDHGLNFIERQVHKLADHNTLEYRRNIAKRDLIKSYLRKNQEEYAISLCLLFNEMDISKAVQELEEVGGGKFLSHEDIEVLNSQRKQFNFPLEILTYLTLRIPTITHHCSICDKFIECQIEENKPTVCTNFKCQFDYISQKRCASIPQAICPQTIYQDIQDNPNIVDILISLCFVAANHNRKDVIFKPFPPMYMKGGDQRDYKSLYAVFKKLPSVENMRKNAKNEMGLKSYLGMDGYELVQWILAVKRVAMVRMTNEKRIKEMSTEYQYMLLIDDPTKTKVFEKAREKYGSYFAFHGSGLENWHSILRRGLLVGSGTDLQTTGAAFGKGIYLAPRSGTSMGYSRVGNSWPKSKFGVSGVKLISICEVVKGPDVPTVASPHYVVNQPQFVTCRFFCWYSSGVGQNGVNIDTIDLHQQYLGGKGKKGTEEKKKK